MEYDRDGTSAKKYFVSIEEAICPPNLFQKNIVNYPFPKVKGQFTVTLSVMQMRNLFCFENYFTKQIKNKVNTTSPMPIDIRVVAVLTSFW